MYKPVRNYPSKRPQLQWIGTMPFEDEYPHESPESFHAVRARAQNWWKLQQGTRRAEEKRIERQRRRLSLWRRIRDGPPPGSCVRPERDWCRTAWTPELRVWWLENFPVRETWDRFEDDDTMKCLAAEHD